MALEAPSLDLPTWLTASIDDFRRADFEAPIAQCTSADCNDLSIEYRRFVANPENEDELATARAYAMLSAVTNFHFKPSDRNTPYGPMLVTEDRRSAIPEDFRGDPLLALSYAAENATSPVLRARLCDVCWLLDRKRQDFGRAAITAYGDIVDGLQSGTLKERFEHSSAPLGLTARDAIRRALSIARAINWSSAEAERARELALRTQALAIEATNPVPVYWFFEMDIDFSISAPDLLAGKIENYLNSQTSDSSHMVIELWRLAARARHYAKDDEGKHRCQAMSAEALAHEAEKHTSAMLAAHWLSQAIAEYHGIPGKRDRRAQLRHKLIDVQACISEEMSPFSQTMDLSDIAADAIRQLQSSESLVDLLLIFANLDQSPSPQRLTAEAKKSIGKHPLASIFGASFHDDEGKVTHRSEGGGFGDQDGSGAILRQIMQQESIRRTVLARGQIHIARHHIAERFYIGDDTFHFLLQHSPFVPRDLLGTYSRGFARFFAGDYTSALYVLTPMLENSLRTVLKMNGFDVTTFDDTNQTQEDATISALFKSSRKELDRIFGENITTDIENVFLLKPGPSLRHALSHGLLKDDSPYGPDAIYACWLIFRLCCIPLFRQREYIELPL